MHSCCGRVNRISQVILERLVMRYFVNCSSSCSSKDLLTKSHCSLGARALSKLIKAKKYKTTDIYQQSIFVIERLARHLYVVKCLAAFKPSLIHDVSVSFSCQNIEFSDTP